MILILAGLFVARVPFLHCACGGKPSFPVVGTPTEDRAEFRMVICKACRGEGRLTLYDRWFGEAPKPAH